MCVRAGNLLNQHLCITVCSSLHVLDCNWSARSCRELLHLLLLCSASFLLNNKDTSSAPLFATGNCVRMPASTEIYYLLLRHAYNLLL